MDISSVGNGSALTPEIQAQYAVKLIQMAREADSVAGELLIDTAEISKEALERCTAELQ